MQAHEAVPDHDQLAPRHLLGEVPRIETPQLALVCLEDLPVLPTDGTWVNSRAPCNMLPALCTMSIPSCHKVQRRRKSRG